MTKDNLTIKTKAFVEMGSGEWMSVGKACEATNGENRIREFGAWIAYFKSLGVNTGWYEQQEALTVPARWPHMFDADREVQTDYNAAGIWLDRLEMERKLEAEQVELSAEQKQRIISKMKARWWPNGKPPATPHDHLSEPQGRPVSGLDVEALVRNADKDLAAHRASVAARKTKTENANTENGYGL